MLADDVELLKDILQRVDMVVGDISRMPDFKDGNEAKFFEIISRASIIRQREALSAIISMCENGHGSHAVCFLRPAFEEMLWMRYLHKHPGEAAGLSVRLTIKGVGESIEAQAGYLSPDQMRSLGFTELFVRNFKHFQEMQLGWLRACGKRLGWRKGTDTPSVSHIAQQVGMKAEYDYIYHATSRFVHFSPQELCRRAWGTPDGLTISSSHFATFWGRFAIYWGIRTYMLTVLAAWKTAGIEEGKVDDTLASELFSLIEKLVPVPIVTKAELEWVERGEPPIARR